MIVECRFPEIGQLIEKRWSTKKEDVNWVKKLEKKKKKRAKRREIFVMFLVK